MALETHALVASPPVTAAPPVLAGAGLAEVPLLGTAGDASVVEYHVVQVCLSPVHEDVPDTARKIVPGKLLDPGPRRRGDATEQKRSGEIEELGTLVEKGSARLSLGDALARFVCALPLVVEVAAVVQGQLLVAAVHRERDVAVVVENFHRVEPAVREALVLPNARHDYIVAARGVVKDERLCGQLERDKVILVVEAPVVKDQPVHALGDELEADVERGPRR